MSSSAAHVRGVLLIAALAVAWGTNFLWIKIALAALTPVQLTAARLGLGALVLLVILVVRGLSLPRGWRVWAHLTVAAVLANFAPYLLFAVGEQHVDSSLAGILNATTPLWTILIAVSVGAEQQPTARRTTGIGIGLAGAVVIMQPWQAGFRADLYGALACLSAAASYGLSYVYMARHLTNRGLTPLQLAAAQLIAATVVAAAALPLDAAHPTGPTGLVDSMIAVTALGLVGTGLAYLLNYSLLASSGPTGASVVTYLLPLVAVISGILVLDESVHAVQFAGGAMILLGVILARDRAGQHPSTGSASRPPGTD